MSSVHVKLLRRRNDLPLASDRILVGACAAADYRTLAQALDRMAFVHRRD